MKLAFRKLGLVVLLTAFFIGSSANLSFYPIFVEAVAAPGDPNIDPTTPPSETAAVPAAASEKSNTDSKRKRSQCIRLLRWAFTTKRGVATTVATTLGVIAFPQWRDEGI